MIRQRRIRNVSTWAIILAVVLQLVFTGVSLSKAEGIPMNTADIKPGDEIVFGRYMQSVVQDDMTPVEWVVLERNRDRITVISKKILELRAFHDKQGGILWAKSALRKWLNSEFLNTAFSQDEQKAIVSSDRKSFVLETNKTASSNEKVFLLNAVEARKYFGDPVEKNEEPSDYEYIDQTKGYRKAEVTVYSNRDYSDHIPMGNDKNEKEWWLRDSYLSPIFGSTVPPSYSVFQIRKTVATDIKGVRPALIIDLRKIKDGMLEWNNPVPDPKEAPYTEVNSSITTVPLAIDLDMKGNLFFSKYDVTLSIDQEHIADIPHGRSLTKKISVKPGRHTLIFAKSDTQDIVSEMPVDIQEYSYLVGSFSVDKDSIDISGITCISRYNLRDAEKGNAVREYDRIASGIQSEYTRAYHYRTGGRVKTEQYFLLSENTNKALYFEIPKYIYDDNPATYEPGTYTENKQDHSLSLTLLSGNIVTFSTEYLPDHETDIKEVCEIYISHMYPDIYDAYQMAIVSIIEDQNDDLLDLYEKF